MDRKEVLASVLSSAGLSFDDDKLHKLDRFYDLLIEKNSVMNLTAITEYEDVAIKHFADSLMILKYMDLNNKKVIDIGTGAGFPGIPLKIFCPDMELVLLDSLNKRIDFLNEVITDLSLDKVIAVHGRAEELSRKSEYREQYNVAVSRAVANLSTLVEYCVPFVAPSGYFVSYKGSKASDELHAATNALHLTGCGKTLVHEFTLGSDDMSRVLLCVEKKTHTPDKYPRGGGKPLKSPL